MRSLNLVMYIIAIICFIYYIIFIYTNYIDYFIYINQNRVLKIRNNYSNKRRRWYSLLLSPIIINIIIKLHKMYIEFIFIIRRLPMD